MDIHSAKALALATMSEYGLTQNGWTLVWDNAKSRNGQTRYRSKVISLSLPLTRFRDEDWVRNTIIHECAHALLGPGYGHGPVWKAKFRSMGGNGERCSSDVEAHKIIAKYRAECRVSREVLGHANRMGKRLAGATCRCHSSPILWITQN